MVLTVSPRANIERARQTTSAGAKAAKGIAIFCKERRWPLFIREYDTDCRSDRSIQHRQRNKEWLSEAVHVARAALGGGAEQLPIASGRTVDAAADAERRKRRRLWYLAVKPPMYSVCIVPVLVSSQDIAMSVLLAFSQIDSTRSIPDREEC